MDDNRKLLQQNDKQIYEALVGEEKRQKAGIELIPSENYTYPEVLVALGSIFTNKYSEGYPGRRYYGGQQYTDIIENIARDRAKQLFRCDHANVQPLSGSPMNQAVYMSILNPGDTVLGMELSHGGHLTHGRLFRTWANCITSSVINPTPRKKAELIMTSLDVSLLSPNPS